MTTSLPTRTLTATCPEDVLAAVPVVLGFEPSDSVVMLTFGGTHTFHARVDLPERPGDLAELTDLLVAPARRHRVRAVVLVLYTADAGHARRALRSLERGLGACGVVVSHALRADGSRWYDARGSGAGVPRHGVPYDLSAHRFRVETVVDGIVTHASRTALAATLATDAPAAAAVERLVATTTPLGELELPVCLATHLGRGSVLDDREVAAAVLGLRDRWVRDAAWATMRRETAREHVRLWSDVVRRTPASPADLSAGPSAVLALAAWLAGQGALAWCAVDRCLEADPGNTLGAIVAELLAAAVPPDQWEEHLAPHRRPA